MNLQMVLRTLAIGAFATLIMNIGALVGLRAGLAGHGPRRQGLHFIGRWISYLMHGSCISRLFAREGWDEQSGLGWRWHAQVF